MYFKLSLLVLILACCEGVLYSSFWAPLFNPRILSFRVDAAFDPDAGRRDRQQYIDNYGARGEKLIESLGNGKGPKDVPLMDKVNKLGFFEASEGSQIALPVVTELGI